MNVIFRQFQSGGTAGVSGLELLKAQKFVSVERAYPAPAEMVRKDKRYSREQ